MKLSDLPINHAIYVAVVTWFVRVFTSTINGAGTDANVLLMAYGKTKDGECRRSDEVRLDNKGDNFENGQEDQFKIEMAEIGKPYKIRISHDNSGSFAGWHLDRVRLTFLVTSHLCVFWASYRLMLVLPQ